MTSKTPLPATIREVFERYGIIKPPTAPPLDKLLEAAAEREMKVELNAGPTVSQAMITAPNHDEEFTQVADSPELAVAAALAMALQVTIPWQAPLFDAPEATTPNERPQEPFLAMLGEYTETISQLDAEIEDEFPEVSGGDDDDENAAHTGREIERHLRAARHNVEWDDEAGVVVDLDTGLIWSDEFLESELNRIRATAGAR